MRTTVSLDDRHEDLIEQQKEEMEDDPGTSKAVRRLLDQAAEVDDLRNQLDEARNRHDELRNQLMKANQRIDATNEIVEYVEDERERQTVREWREHKKAHSGLFSRVKWRVTGMPEPPEDLEKRALP
jgi:signal recognition particle GTPase